MKVHMDGARVLNAAVALGVAAKDVVADCDTVWLDFTKGLGAPLGAVLAGPRRTSSARPGVGSSGWAVRCARAG